MVELQAAEVGEASAPTLVISAAAEGRSNLRAGLTGASLRPNVSGDVFPERSEIGAESVARTTAGCIGAEDVGHGYRAFRENDHESER